MSVIKTVGTLTHEAVATAYTAARHPISTAAQTVGFVKGVAGRGLDLVQGGRPETTAGTTTETRVDESRTAVPPPRVPVDVPEIDELPEPIVIEADDSPGESFHTEPKASSRDSDHGGLPGDREEAEGYAEEIVLPDEDLDEPAAVVYTSQTPVEQVADPETIDAIHRVAEASHTPEG